MAMLPLGKFPTGAFALIAIKCSHFSWRLMRGQGFESGRELDVCVAFLLPMTELAEKGSLAPVTVVAKKGSLAPMTLRGNIGSLPPQR